GLGRSEKSSGLNWRQLSGITENQDRHTERQKIASELGVDHRALVDDNELGLRCRRVLPQIEARHLGAAVARSVDQAVDRGGAAAALTAHDERGLAGERRKQDLAVDVFGNVARESGLAGSRIAEQTEHLRRA